jgi:hypothetical protein
MQVDGERMENLPLIIVHVSYLMAFILLGSVLVWRNLLSRRTVAPGPPALPTGKVPEWFYNPADLLGVLLFFLIFYGLAATGAAMQVEPTGD